MRWLLWGLLCSSAACAVSPEPAPPTASLRILVTNDDGVDAPGLAALVKALDPLGEIVVCAPEQNCSGASQSSVSFGEALRVSERVLEGAELARAVSGRPVDAVAFGVLELGRERGFDLVVSGINAGANVGLVAHYSGTVGAALEGARRGLPAVAVSLESRDGDLAHAAAFAARFVAEMMAQGPAANLVYAINVPAGRPTAAVAALMGGMYLDLRGFEPRGDGTWRAVLAPPGAMPAGSDSAAYQAGQISITPLRVDWSDTAELRRLQGWKLGGE